MTTLAGCRWPPSNDCSPCISIKDRAMIREDWPQTREPPPGIYTEHTGCDIATVIIVSCAGLADQSVVGSLAFFHTFTFCSRVGSIVVSTTLHTVQSQSSSVQCTVPSPHLTTVLHSTVLYRLARLASSAPASENVRMLTLPFLHTHPCPGPSQIATI